jgi:hypothetical protein
MSRGVLCSSTGCNGCAAFKFTWPGKDQSAVCALCAAKVRSVASSIGLRVELRSITAEEHANSALEMR